MLKQVLFDLRGFGRQAQISRESSEMFNLKMVFAKLDFVKCVQDRKTSQLVLTNSRCEHRQKPSYGHWVPSYVYFYVSHMYNPCTWLNHYFQTNFIYVIFEDQKHTDPCLDVWNKVMYTEPFCVCQMFKTKEDTLKRNGCKKWPVTFFRPLNLLTISQKRN